MRAILIGAALAMTLTAAGPVAAPGAPWVLRGDGLGRTVAGRQQVLRFGISRAAATAAVSAVLGKPTSSQTSPDCGQGVPMVLVTYKGGLTLQFLNGKFSGWSVDPPADPQLRTPAGITIGSTRAAVMRAYPDAEIDDGSLGVMFIREDGPSGFLDGTKPSARVIGLFAGKTCMIS
jgi:hypothetical protein